MDSYIDPPDLDLYNAYNNSYANKQIDDENNVIDNTQICIDN